MGMQDFVTRQAVAQMLGLLSVGPVMRRSCSGCSSSLKQWHRSSEERSFGKPRAGCHEHCRIESHSGAAVKFFLRASLLTSAFPSVLEESSDTNFHSFQQNRSVVLMY